MPDSGPEENASQASNPGKGTDTNQFGARTQGPGTGAPCCAALGRRSLSFLRGSSVQALKPFLDYIKGWARRTQADKQNFLIDSESGTC